MDRTTHTTDETRDGLIVLVTDSRAEDRLKLLSERLGERTGYRIRSMPVDDLEDAFDRWCPDGFVLTIDRSDRLRELIDRVRSRAVGTPIVVAPQRGSEELATTAFRANASEYAPLERDGAADRIAEAIRSRETEIRGRDDEFRHILADELPDEAFIIGEDGTYFEAKVRPEAEDLYTISSDELPGLTLSDCFPDDTAASLQKCIDRTLRTEEVRSIEYDLEASGEWRRFEARVVPLEERVEGQRAVVWLARDITDRAKRERELRSRQAQLETLNRINAVVRQVIETLVEAPARNAIEREVCNQLVDSELYCGSWIAERAGNGSLAYRTGAGDATTYLERARTEEFTAECPFQRAARTGTVQTVTHILERQPLPDPLQAAAREDDVRAAIAVPICHDDATYGVLSVLASRPDAFSDSEKDGFELLGETIGFTIMAVKNRQLLFADTIVELEFRIDGGETFSFDLSEEYDCTCSLEWAGTTVEGRTYQFVTVAGLDGETVMEEARAHDSVEECRLIHDRIERCTIEMRLCESGVRTLTNYGVTIRDVTVEDGIGTCRIEVPQDADIRELADALAGIYENTELVARREVDREVRTAAERRNRILDELTERQLSTLRLAYYGGFFDWPRESTGEEIAAAMDVSPPTMHQHLRKGLKTILGEFFESGGATTE
ncbi:bacterio-opsin activator domain-containing protein [Natrarchaeobius oligotrophus]|uniref:PAS domain S-box protein n=1 Tax=Natrarchaeobius chitinivorans TaxID=1679083 RepID=A0A3N6M9F8_NATCH|nr:bacterio-opsin activator domain-containing protein [Natrarchaeobius chitinivorans]RQH00394.1 PAS domain S-box protein [Natrarchaeobius chitinivorans]